MSLKNKGTTVTLAFLSLDKNETYKIYSLDKYNKLINLKSIFGINYGNIPWKIIYFFLEFKKNYDQIYEKNTVKSLKIQFNTNYFTKMSFNF